tara:strand:+ start:932 stop:1060 length:129 start_codon:yes stop_codon:yes gene_type:complete
MTSLEIREAYLQQSILMDYVGIFLIATLVALGFYAMYRISKI